MTRTSSWIPSPSFYAFLLPNHHRSSVDALAATGQFPALDGLFSSCGYMLLFGMLRMICTYLVMKPLAIQCLKITYNDNKRHNIACDKKITKFVEAMWRFLLYTYFCYLGYQALFVPKPVSWIVDREGNWGNPEEHWRGWPVQSISTAILFYYNIQLGCYLHQLSWTEVSRSDALEMILHHIVTIFLILFSYLTNFTRIGASILLLHDSADIFLESAKIFNYISKTEGQKKVGIICDTLFAIFAIVFLITRLILFPRYCVYSLVFHAPMMLGGTWPGYWIFASLLVTLQCLHIFWFYLIMRMVVGLVSSGVVEKDVRESDDEGEFDVDDANDIKDGDAKGDKGTTPSRAPPTLQRGGKKKLALSNTSSSPIRSNGSHRDADGSGGGNGSGDGHLTTRSGRKVKKVS